jgi:O-antigen/teichoic acid export membrane protein
MTLGNKIKTAFRWGASVKLIGQVFTWAMTIVVIRLLSPEDYGLMAMSVLFLHFLMLVNEMGLGAVLVHRSDLDIETKRKIFGLIITVNSTFFILLFAAAPIIANFFGEEQLTTIIRVLAFQFIIAAFEIIPVAHLERNLDFKSKSLVSLGASVVGGITTLFLALADYGVWALIWGNMLVLFLQTVGFNIVSPFRHLPIFSLKKMRDIASFGGLVTSERAMWFFYTQADIFIVGKLLGKDQLGVYSVAMHLASLILKAVRIMSFVTFPLFLGMSSVAPELVAVLLGDTWIMAGDVMAILCLIMPLRMLANIFPPLLQGIGRPDASVINLLFAVVVMPIAFFVGTRWGVIGVSIAWAVAYPVVFAVMLARSVPLIGVSIKQPVMAAAMPALVSIVMYIAVISSKSMMNVDTDMMRLVSSITIGASVYATLSRFVCRREFSEVLELVRR